MKLIFSKGTIDVIVCTVSFFLFIITDLIPQSVGSLSCSAPERRERHIVLGSLHNDLDLRQELTVELFRRILDLDTLKNMFTLQDWYKLV
jgi:hypothetical protein